MKYKILLIDDNPLDVATTIAEFEKESDVNFVIASTAGRAVELVKKSPSEYAVVLLDYNLPGMKGDQVAKELLSMNNQLNIVILSGDPTQTAAINTMKAGACDFIDKRASAKKKISIVRSYCHKFDDLCRVLESQDCPTERTKIIEQVGLIGKSKSLAEIARTIIRIKESSSTVLIRGPSGTGKELIARAIHQHSSRKNRPFVAINCGAIPEGLIESELFGHERGAFTNAIIKKIGKFQVANYGTIFLDEIGEMPPSMQVRLLRTLQEGTIDPVEAKEPIRVDVRVVAATNRNLEEAIKTKDFREDLYYRLNVIPIHVSALRERKEDIEPLISHFTRSHETGSHKKFLYSTLKYFLDYPWKGNVVFGECIF